MSLPRLEHLRDGRSWSDPRNLINYLGQDLKTGFTSFPRSIEASSIVFVHHHFGDPNPDKSWSSQHINYVDPAARLLRWAQAVFDADAQRWRWDVFDGSKG